MRRPTVAVCGAGPAGVAAAYRLGRRGIADVVVLESAPFVGGHAASVHVAGRSVDLGSHRLHPSCDPRIRADIEHALGEPLVDLPRHGRIRISGRWLDFPPRPLDLLRSAPPGLSARLAGQALRRPSRQSAGTADSYADDLRARFGPALCEELWFPYARKLWGLDPRDISHEQSRARVGAASAGAVAIRTLRRFAGGTRRFAHPRQGFGSMFEALADASRGDGVDIRVGDPVQGLHFDGDRFRSARTATGGGEVEADLCLSTLPLPRLAALVDPGPPDDVVAAAAALEHRAMLVVYLVVDADRFSGYDAHYLPDDAVCVARLSEPAHYTDAWPPGPTVLCAEVPCAEGDNLWAGTDGDVVARVVEDLALSDLSVGAVVDSRVVRLPRVYPVFRRGFEPAYESVKTWVASLDGFVTMGRQGLFLHDNSHQAMEMGYVAADCVTPDGGFDSLRWANALGRFARNVVED